jgi:alpha/beta superfamily hydrolase
MISRRTPVSFVNKSGQRLFGILHQPGGDRAADVAIILLSPGVKMRVAPHRLYNKMADRFVALGYPVLRFDFFGLGDSEGTVDEALLADLYGAVQVGRYVDDTIAAMDWLQQTEGITRFVVSGLCGGAITGLLAGVKDERIVGLLALAIPVILDGSNIDFTRHMTDAQLQGTREGYLRRLNLLDRRVWRSWWRFITFRSHYSLIARSLVKPITARIRSQGGTPSAGAPAPLDNTNPYFAPALLHMLSKSCPVLLIFAGADRLYWEFESKFMKRHEATLEPFASWYAIHVTPDSNHIFSFPEWQTDMLDRSSQWLAHYFAAGSLTPWSGSAMSSGEGGQP